MQGYTLCPLPSACIINSIAAALHPPLPSFLPADPRQQKRQRKQSKEQLLAAAQEKAAAATELGASQEGKAQLQKEAWGTALQRAKGDKVLDDPRLLKRSMKKVGTRAGWSGWAGAGRCNEAWLCSEAWCFRGLVPRRAGASHWHRASSSSPLAPLLTLAVQHAPSPDLLLPCIACCCLYVLCLCCRRPS
jgi:hypothetical protein